MDSIFLFSHLYGLFISAINKLHVSFICLNTYVHQSRYSFGGVIRDSGGAFIAAKCQSFPRLFCPREAEALAIREALSWIKNL